MRSGRLRRCGWCTAGSRWWGSAGRGVGVVIDDGDVEPEVVRLELPSPQLDDDLPELFDAEEQPVNVEAIGVDVVVDLASDGGKAAPKPEQRLLEPAHQGRRRSVRRRR